MQFAELPSGVASPLLLVKMEPRNEKPGIKTWWTRTLVHFGVHLFPFLFHEKVDISICFFPPSFLWKMRIWPFTSELLFFTLSQVQGPSAKLFCWELDASSSPFHTLLHNYIDLISALMKCQALIQFYVLLSAPEGSVLWKGVQADPLKFE